MSTAFRSKVSFNEQQIELMISDLRDLLGKLREKGVLDFLKENGVRLLDRKNTRIEFKTTEYTEVKRFLALVRESLPLLTHLTRNLTSLIAIDEVERHDRIMGSINTQKTIAANRNNFSKTKAVICNEIHKNKNSPENQILIHILFSIVLYCDRYISTSGILNSGACLDGPTLYNLNSVRNYAITLLSSDAVKRIMPYALSNISNFDHFFIEMMNRIYLGKIPEFFTGIYNLLHKWKYFVWLSSKNYDLLEGTLRYHFFNLKSYDKLYECWIFYKLLDLLIGTLNLKFKEVSSSGGIATFRSVDGSVKITYQKSYDTGWMDKDKSIQDIPDVVVEFNNSITIIFDAKNSTIPRDNVYPYRRQMDSYLRSAGIEKTNFGIFIFSAGEERYWKQIEKQNQKMLWIGVSPEFSSKNKLSNNNAMEKLTQIIKQCTAT
jgi:hypothetical protein